MITVVKKQKIRGLVFSCAFFIALFSLGCSPKVSGLSAKPGEVELNQAGENFQIKANALDQENQPIVDAVLQWVSSNPEVVEVSHTGLLTAKGSGNAAITITSPGVPARRVIPCKVSILAAINVQPKALNLNVGKKYEMKATALNERTALFEDQTIGWDSSDDKIVFIDALGHITALTPGKATITATTPSQRRSSVRGKATVTVTE